MKKTHSFLLLLLIFVLFACGVPSQANLGKSGDGKNESINKEIRQLVVDNEHIKITVLNMKKIKKNSKTTVTVHFDILNKREDTIKIQAQRLSVDDRMVDAAIYQMEQEISPQKAANAKLTIRQTEDAEFPEFENDMEMELLISSLEDPSYTETRHVKIIY